MLRKGRFFSMMAVAVAAALMAAQPVAAARILVDCTGDCADYELYDEQVGRRGANCLYEAANPGELNKITVRAPQMHGLATDPMTSRVEWRFKIRRNPPGGGNTFNTIFTSSWQKDQANDQFVGDFTRRPWTAPEGVTGFYQVFIEMQWWQAGSPQGFIRAQYEWYKAKRPGLTPYINNEYCLPHF